MPYFYTKRSGTLTELRCVLTDAQEVRVLTPDSLAVSPFCERAAPFVKVIAIYVVSLIGCANIIKFAYYVRDARNFISLFGLSA